MTNKKAKNILSSLIKWLYSLSVFLTLALGIGEIIFLFTYNLTSATYGIDLQNDLISENYQNYLDFINNSGLFVIRWSIVNILIIVIYDIYIVVKKKLSSLSIQWLIKRELILKSLWVAYSNVLFINAHIWSNTDLYEKLPDSMNLLLKSFSTELIIFLIFVFIPIYGGLYYLALKLIEFIVRKVRKEKVA